MREWCEAGRKGERGFTLIELMVVVLIVGLLGAIAVPAYQGSIDKARRVALVSDAQALHQAMTQYHIDQSAYPTEFGPGALDPETFEPLVSQGYFPQAETLLSKLEDRRVLIYFAPDIGGIDAEYVAIMRHALDTDLHVLAANTTLLGHNFDGVYVLIDGFWVRVDEA